jgi:hypothetical protein
MESMRITEFFWDSIIDGPMAATLNNDDDEPQLAASNDNNDRDRD